MSGIQWGQVCGLLGTLMAAVILSNFNLQRQRAGRIYHSGFGVVSRSHRPRLFQFLIIYGWFCVGLLVIGALVIAHVVRFRWPFIWPVSTWGLIKM
jgi:ABC-type Fe3+ transport system permease subunit